VQWAENSAGAGKLPEMKPFVGLIKPGPAAESGQLLREPELTGPRGDTRVWVADFNGDGKLDLLVGDSVTLVSPANGLSEGEFKEKSAAWQKAFEKASKEFESAGTDKTRIAKAQEQYSTVYEERTEFMEEDDTGFVWLYLQK
jgi:hypothetical protein